MPYVQMNRCHDTERSVNMADVLKIAEKASLWWGKQIMDTANTFNYNAGSNNAYSTIMVTLDAIANTPTPEAQTAFIRNLQSIILRELENNPENHQVMLSCSTAPCPLLCEAASESGIDFSVFPLSRTMVISTENILISTDECKSYSSL